MAKKTAGTKTVTKRRAYVVGYVGDHNCVYGPNNPDTGCPTFTNRLTRAEATTKAAEMQSLDSTRVIYKLVPVRVYKPNEIVRAPKRRATR